MGGIDSKIVNNYLMRDLVFAVQGGPTHDQQVRHLRK
jgi:hypothetical protein